MKKSIIIILLFIQPLFIFAQASGGHITRKTIQTVQSNLTPLERKIVGWHAIGIQMVSFWDYFGTCEIKKIDKNKYRCVGKQKEKNVYLRIDGYISIISESHLRFSGAIITKILGINNGKESSKQGTFDFKSTENGKYWRIEEKSEPEDFSYYISIEVNKL